MSVPKIISRQFSQTITRSQWMQLYTTVFSVMGFVIILYASTQMPTDWVYMIGFAMIAAAAELMRVELFASSRFSSVSVSGIVAMASLLAFGPLAGVLTHTISGLTNALSASLGPQAATRGGRVSGLRRSSFNIGMWAVSSALAGLLYMKMGGTIGHISYASNILPFVCAAGVDVLVNLIILTGIIAIQTGRNPLKIWQQDFLWTLPITLLGSLLGGAGLALAYEKIGMLGVAVFCLPVLTTSYAFQLYANNMRGYVSKLEEANTALDKINTELLETLGVVIDADDMYTAGHSAQVAIYTEALVQKMGLPKNEQDMIVKAALIHDVGKIGIPDSIMSKPGPLTKEEYEQLKRHSVIGAEIISRMHGLQEMVPLVRHHHERWDGRGYPDGLHNTDIPLGARILAVADTLDAMCSDRPYRPTCSFEEVQREMDRCAGVQFDPVVIRAFQAMAKEKGPEFFRNSALAVDSHMEPGESSPRNDHAVLRYLKRSMLPTANNGSVQITVPVHVSTTYKPTEGVSVNVTQI